MFSVYQEKLKVILEDNQVNATGFTIKEVCPVCRGFATVSVPLHDMEYGTEKVKCSNCKGSGMITISANLKRV